MEGERQLLLRKRHSPIPSRPVARSIMVVGSGLTTVGCCVPSGLVAVVPVEPVGTLVDVEVVICETVGTWRVGFVVTA